VRRLLLLPVAVLLASAFVGRAVAAPGTTHVAYSHNWQGITFVTGLESCPIFGASSAFDAFPNVNLTDHIVSAFTPYDEPLYQIDSVGSVRGVIDAPDGAYTVAGGGFKEHRIDTLDTPFFSGSGHLTITGPGGTVVGQAVFQDLSEFPPPEFDLLFTSVTSCHLK
jgi:hypothetical protein